MGPAHGALTQLPLDGRNQSREPTFDYEVVRAGLQRRYSGFLANRARGDDDRQVQPKPTNDREHPERVEGWHRSAGNNEVPRRGLEGLGEGRLGIDALEHRVETTKPQLPDYERSVVVRVLDE